MTSATRKLTPPFMRTFDTHKYIKLLKSKGVKEPQAEVFVQAISDSRDADFAALATKEQMETVKAQVNRLEEDMKEMKKDIKFIMRWVIGLVIGTLTVSATIAGAVIVFIMKH